MPDSPKWPPTTLRAAVNTAQGALASGRLDSARSEHHFELAFRALDHAIDLLDGSDREMGAFHEAEPFRLVLDPPPVNAPAKNRSADDGPKLLV